MWCVELLDYSYTPRKKTTSSQGIRKGCPLLALLFILFVETSACKRRKIPQMKGFNIVYNVGSKCVKI